MPNVLVREDDRIPTTRRRSARIETDERRLRNGEYDAGS